MARTGAAGCKAEYFNTASFNGQVYRAPGKTPAAAAPNAKPLFTRVDAEINFKWWDGAPRADMDDDNFGVRWSGFLAPKVTGKYRLGGVGMNAFEIYFNGKQLVRANNRDERNYSYETVDLEAGKLYPIRVDFHEVINDADMRLVWAVPGRDLEPAALDAARQAEAVVMFLGLSPRLEGEEMKVPVAGFQGGDRVDLGLPAAQEALLQKVVALGKPVVLVLLNGSALAVNWARDHVPALVEAWYPGQAGGTAIADVLFGDYNPAGRLPVTFYQSADQLPAFDDYSMKGRTYRYFQGEPLIRFGYGLSYTTFGYSRFDCPEQAPANHDVPVSVEVRNTGKVAGEEVVQLYVKRDGVRSLEGFHRIALNGGRAQDSEVCPAGAPVAEERRRRDRRRRQAARRFERGRVDDDVEYRAVDGTSILVRDGSRIDVSHWWETLTRPLWLTRRFRRRWSWPVRYTASRWSPSWVHTSSISGVDAQFAGFDGIWCVPASPYANTGAPRCHPLRAGTRPSVSRHLRRVSARAARVRAKCVRNAGSGTCRDGSRRRAAVDLAACVFAGRAQRRDPAGGGRTVSPRIRAASDHRGLSLQLRSQSGVRVALVSRRSSGDCSRSERGSARGGTRRASLLCRRALPTGTPRTAWGSAAAGRRVCRRDGRVAHAQPARMRARS